MGEDRNKEALTIGQIVPSLAFGLGSTMAVHGLLTSQFAIAAGMGALSLLGIVGAHFFSPKDTPVFQRQNFNAMITMWGSLIQSARSFLEGDVMLGSSFLALSAATGSYFFATRKPREESKTPEVTDQPNPK